MKTFNIDTSNTSISLYANSYTIHNANKKSQIPSVPLAGKWFTKNSQDRN